MAALGEKKAVVVCGPTATGKTDLAFALCRAFGGELIGADSMQIYHELPVGTAAPTPAEAQGVPMHLVSFLGPEEPFSAADFVRHASAAMGDIATRGRLPVLCGGTGLYISSLVKEYDFTEAAPVAARRQALEAAYDEGGGEAMLRDLVRQGCTRAAGLHPNDKKRVVRAAEAWLDGLDARGTCQPETGEAGARKAPARQYLLLGLACERAQLYERIEARVDRMMAQGLLAEAEYVYTNRDVFATATQAIGYKEFFPFFAGEALLESCVAKLKQATRNYAKRQITWFKKMDDIHWLDVTEGDAMCEVEKLVDSFLG